MTAKRNIEVFSAGCSVCQETITMVRGNACPSCEVRVLDMKDPDVAARAKSLGIYVGFWFGRTLSYIVMIYSGNAVLTPFLEMFEDRLTGILLIDGAGIGLIILFASVNWTLLITQRKLKFVKPKIWRF